MVVSREGGERRGEEFTVYGVLYYYTELGRTVLSPAFPTRGPFRFSVLEAEVNYHG
jgi:hypothetical protein